MIHAIMSMHSDSGSAYVVCGGLVLNIEPDDYHVSAFTICYTEDGQNYPVFCNYGCCSTENVPKVQHASIIYGIDLVCRRQCRQ